MAKYWILDGKTPVPVDDVLEWGRWFENAREKRIVASTPFDGGRVSTVFLGIDHQWGDGPPLLFETMIFRGEDGGEMWRCSTWDEAEKQHAEAVRIANDRP